MTYPSPVGPGVFVGTITIGAGGCGVLVGVIVKVGAFVAVLVKVDVAVWVGVCMVDVSVGVIVMLGAIVRIGVTIGVELAGTRLDSVRSRFLPKICQAPKTTAITASTIRVYNSGLFNLFPPILIL